jgi:hypothetical protein
MLPFSHIYRMVTRITEHMYEASDLSMPGQKWRAIASQYGIGQVQDIKHIHTVRYKLIEKQRNNIIVKYYSRKYVHVRRATMAKFKDYRKRQNYLSESLGKGTITTIF